jgi:ketosteroid isomerase-like protein
VRESDRLVQAFFDAVTAGALPDELLTADMTGWITTAGTMDREAYRALIPMLASMCATPIAFTIDAITAEADRAVAEVRSIATLIDGQRYEQTYVYVFRFRDGRIAHVAEHYNALIAQEKLVPLMRRLQG